MEKKDPCSQRRASKTGCVVGPGLKIGVSWVITLKVGMSFILKIQQTEAHSTGVRILAYLLKLLFNYIQIYLFMKSHNF